MCLFRDIKSPEVNKAVSSGMGCMCVCVSACVHVHMRACMRMCWETLEWGIDRRTYILGDKIPRGKELFELALRERALSEPVRTVAFKESHSFRISGSGFKWMNTHWNQNWAECYVLQPAL